LKRYWRTALVFLFLLAGCAGGSDFKLDGAGSTIAQETQEISTSTRTATAAQTRNVSTATAARTPTHIPATALPTETPVPTQLPAEATRASTQLATTTVPRPTGAALTVEGAIVVDHRSIDLFDQIPEEYLDAARSLRMMFMDQSVGANIDMGLDCLTAASWGRSSAYCRRDYYQINGSEWLWKTYQNADLQAGSVPAAIRFQPDATRYNRSNWTFVSQQGDWQEYLQAFLQQHVPGMLDQKDVFSYQFTYLHVNAGSTIANPEEGFFVDQPHHGYYSNRERWDISDLEELAAEHPDKIFYYWTTSLARDIGSPESALFNEQMRQYAQTHSKPLLDAADILSHDPDGNPCYDNRDAVKYCGANGCEDFAEDGQNNLAICQAYTTETNGGHLGSVSGGKVRLAKAVWVLMAQIAGWRP
jgi:hypothetical protein